MGYMMLVASCYQCGRTFTCNPNLVPSYENNPFCQTCVEAANPQRIANGLEPIVIQPGAYEAADEAEVY